MPFQKHWSFTAKTQSGQLIDIALDKGAFRQMTEAAKASKNQFAIGYIARVCDLTNLKSFLRMRHMNKDFATLLTVFVEGGQLFLPMCFLAHTVRIIR